MKKKILLVQNLLLLSAALSLAIFTTSCDREEDNPVTVTPSGGGDGTGNDGGGGGEFVEETLTFTVNGVDFVMKPVPGGTFYMGAQSTDPSGQNYDADALSRESPVHQVTLSDYYMCETEVTQELWQAVMGSNPSYCTGNLQRPVECVSWNEIVNDFLPALNAVTGRTFTLPSEAQWEFAARGGNSSHGYKYAGSNTVGDVAWFSHNSGNTTHPVKGKSPNELGLYDMSGNVFEWCKDWYDIDDEDRSHYYYQECLEQGTVENPTGPSSGSYRVLRGGCWNYYAEHCRVSYRTAYAPHSHHNRHGFRLVLLP